MTPSPAAVEPAFGLRLEAHQNKFLPEGEGELTAVLSLVASGFAPPAELAEVVLVDCSGSMDTPQTKIMAARRAACAAVDTLPDGAAFAVVQGTTQAAMVYPSEQRLSVASPETRAAAKRAVRRLVAAGGTAIGRWLDLAGALLDTGPAGIRHSILLTDGKNEHEDPAALGRVLEACAGRFDCDVRAIGDGWDPTEVYRIAAALHGTADEVAEADLAADFRAMVESAKGRVVPDLRLTVRTTVPGARILSVRQVTPMERDLTPDAITLDDRTTEFALGSWGVQAADYELVLSVDPTSHPRLEDIQVALARLRPVGAADLPPVDPVGVLAHWTDDPALPAAMEPKLSIIRDQDELARAVNAGCEAYERKDLTRAATEWGTALRLARRTDNQKIVGRLERLVHVDDAAAGLVRIRDDLTRRALMSAVLVSHFRAPGPGPSASPDGRGDPDADRTPQGNGGAPDAPDQVCGRCEWVSPGTARICTNCQWPLGSRP